VDSCIGGGWRDYVFSETLWSAGSLFFALGPDNPSLSDSGSLGEGDFLLVVVVREMFPPPSSEGWHLFFSL